MLILELIVEITLTTVILILFIMKLVKLPVKIKQFDSIFDNEKYRDFSDINLMKEEVNEKYNQLILASIKMIQRMRLENSF